jgi:hypothetical protein
MGMALFFYVLVLFIGGIGLVEWVAKQKGRSPGAWVCIALACSPPVALIGLAAVPERRREDAPAEVSEDIPEFKWRKG